MAIDQPDWQDHLPLDDLPESGAAAWGEDLADAFGDPGSFDPFTAEIESVNASDWDVDTDLIWGDDSGDPGIADGGESLGLDLSF